MKTVKKFRLLKKAEFFTNTCKKWYIRQKADTVELLCVLGYPIGEIEQIEKSFIEEKKILMKERLFTYAFFAITAFVVGFGTDMFYIRMKENEAILEEVLGEEVNYENEYLEVFDSENEDDEKVVAPVPNTNIDYEYLYGGIMDRIISEVSDAGGLPGYLRYTFYDIDKDGYMDFIMENGTCDADMKIEVYTTKNGETIYKVGESYYHGELYENLNGVGFYTDYGKADYETVVYLYIEHDMLKETVLYDNIYTTQYGYLDGKKIKELESPIRVYYVDEQINQQDLYTGFIFPNSSVSYLTEYDIMAIDPSLLRLARNEIFARHGYIFSSDEMNDYFMEKTWYAPTINADDFDMEALLNDYEKANISLIKSFEEN